MKMQVFLFVVLLNSIANADPFIFRDVAKDVGLTEPLKGMMGHSAAWGDVNGDGWIDLFVGTFTDRPDSDYIAGGAKGPVPNMLLLNQKGVFKKSPQKSIAWHGRAGGSAFADFDNDGRLDLYVSNNGRLGKDNLLYHNEGGGKLKVVTDQAGAPMHLPETARSIGVLDYDGDGLLDLFVLATVRKGHSLLFRNRGNMKFENSNAVPDDITGLGLAVGDLTGNGWPDIMVGGSNRLLVNMGKGQFREATEFQLGWEFRAEDVALSCGIAFGDIDRDGDLDMVIGSHTKRPWAEPIPLRVYLNQGSTIKKIVFEEITEKAGFKPLPMKTPHVEIRDFDNDGWPDIYAAIVIYRDGKTYPVIYRNQGEANGGLPKFQEEAFQHCRKFPGPEDYVPGAKSADFYDRLVANKKLMYFAPGPSGDFDNDGRLDLFLPSWFPRQASLLLKNETKSGNYVDVVIEGQGHLNLMGIGAMVRAYPAGKAHTVDNLIASEQISTAYGYTSGQPAVAHLGIADAASCDLVIELPFGKSTVVLKDVKANQRRTVTAGR